MGVVPGAAAPAVAAPGSLGGSSRQARLPRRLLAASAIVAALAASLLVPTAVYTGHTELRLSAGVQLSIGRAARMPAPHAAAASVQQPKEQQRQPRQALPPLPDGNAPPAASGDDPLEEDDDAYGSAYEGADLMSLFGGRQGGSTRQARPTGGASQAVTRSAGGTPVKTVQPKPVVTAEAAAARDSSTACGEVGRALGGVEPEPSALLLQRRASLRAQSSLADAGACSAPR